MTVHTLRDGKVAMWSTLEDFAGPKEVELRLRAEAHPDGRWTVAPADFGDDGEVLIEDIDTGPLGKATLQVTLGDAAVGSVDLASGAMHVDATFEFFIALGTSTLELRLDGGKHGLPTVGVSTEGAPWNRDTGELKLAGVGVFDGGWLNGDECLVLLQGRLDPNPWP